MSEQIIVPGLAEAQQHPATGKTAVSIYDGHVVLHFEHATEHAVYAPLGAISDAAKMILSAVAADPKLADTVLAIAATIADEANAARGSMKPAGGALKHELIERHRQKLTKRLEVVMNTRREKRTVSNHKLAKELVEIMLKEVFA